MIRIAVNAIGLCAPGLINWSESQGVLLGSADYCAERAPVFSRSLLPPNERRRTSFAIRLALQAAYDALGADIGAARSLRSVFACSGGDTEALDNICTALTLPGQPLSPTQFNNSVHNAAAGYWTIATGSHEPSISLSAYDASFAAGLLEAANAVIVEHSSVLLVAFDVPPPSALLPFRRVETAFATALLLTAPDAGNNRYNININIVSGYPEDRLIDPALEILRRNNPAARSLPLLKALANRGTPERVILPYLPDSQLLLELIC